MAASNSRREAVFQGLGVLGRFDSSAVYVGKVLTVEVSCCLSPVRRSSHAVHLTSCGSRLELPENESNWLARALKAGLKAHSSGSERQAEVSDRAVHVRGLEGLRKPLSTKFRMFRWAEEPDFPVLGLEKRS